MNLKVTYGDWRVRKTKSASCHLSPVTRHCSAFTLIEIMIVVAIMAVVMAMGLPPILSSMHPESLRKATTELREVCNNARARAILNGTTTKVIFHPGENRFEVSGTADPNGAPSALFGMTGQLPADVKIQMLDINLHESKELETAEVRFFPNGTSDEMTVVFISDEGKQSAVTLEVTTGLADINGDASKLLPPR